MSTSSTLVRFVENKLSKNTYMGGKNKVHLMALKTVNGHFYASNVKVV